MCQAHSSCLDEALILVIGERRNMVCVFDISAVRCSYTRQPFPLLKRREVKLYCELANWPSLVSAACNE